MTEWVTLSYFKDRGVHDATRGMTDIECQVRAFGKMYRDSEGIGRIKADTLEVTIDRKSYWWLAINPGDRFRPAGEGVWAEVTRVSGTTDTLTIVGEAL